MITKREIEEQKRKQTLKEAPMDFDTQDRPDPGIVNKLAQNDTPITKVPLPRSGNEPNSNFQELLASERYRQVVEKVRQYTHIDTPMIGTNQTVMQLSQMMGIAHNNIVDTERRFREQLEQLAVEVVTKEMGIPEGSFLFDVKIVGMGEIDMDGFRRNEDDENPEEVDIDGDDEEQGGQEQGGQEQGDEDEEMEMELFHDLKQLNLEKAKRRLMNAMVQGASKRGHYMYQLVPERIREITGSDTLINDYGILMSINDSFYWQLPDQLLDTAMGGGEGGEGAVGGKEEVDMETDPPTIKVRGVNFPVLVHELIKGVMQVLSFHGMPQKGEEHNEDMFDAVKRSENTLDKEVWDLRLGPAIWDRIRRQIPQELIHDENKKELQHFLFQNIFSLPAKQFLTLMKEVISGSEEGARLLSRMVNGIEEMFRNEDYEASMAQFNTELIDTTEKTSDQELEDYLSDLGISGFTDDNDEDYDDDYLSRNN